MIAMLLNVLRSHGLLDEGVIPPFTTLLSGQTVYEIQISQRQVIFAKLTCPPDVAAAQGWMHLDLKREHHGLTTAHRLLPGQVPEPLLLHEAEDWQVLVTRDLKHRPLTHALLRSPTPLVLEQVQRFFKKLNGAGALAAPQSWRATLRELVSRYVDLHGVERTLEWLSQPSSNWIDELPASSQHGDFVLNNLGVNESGLVFFDWEDYGQSPLPGLDLCTILISTMSFDVPSLKALFAGREAPLLRDLVEQICPMYGLDAQRFEALFSIYLLAFLDLKRGRDPMGLQELRDLQEQWNAWTD